MNEHTGFRSDKAYSTPRQRQANNREASTSVLCTRKESSNYEGFLYIEIITNEYPHARDSSEDTMPIFLGKGGSLH